MENIVEFMVSGKFALFTDPLSKIGGEKCSYQIPTYEALKGILSSVYWKPTIIWIIDKLRVMNPIRTQTRNIRPIKYSGIYPAVNDLAMYTYLIDVKYQVQAHFVWNLNRQDLLDDRNENKHYFVTKRMIKMGGRRDIFLGTRECQGYVEPCRFGDGEGFYDQYGELQYDLMFHGFDYPDEFGKNEFRARFWKPVMVNGVVDFIPPEKCDQIKKIYNCAPEIIATSGLNEAGLLEAYIEKGSK
jgi:CRISPR-associated protein Cas5d